MWSLPHQHARHPVHNMLNLVSNSNTIQPQNSVHATHSKRQRYFLADCKIVATKTNDIIHAWKHAFHHTCSFVSRLLIAANRATNSDCNCTALCPVSSAVSQPYTSDLDRASCSDGEVSSHSRTLVSVAVSVPKSLKSHWASVQPLRSAYLRACLACKESALHAIGQGVIVSSLLMNDPITSSTESSK